jgi:hypothetical protein
MSTNVSESIIQFLKTHGDGLDAEMATALHIPLAQVRSHVLQLSSAGEVISCKVIRYINGKEIEGISCRLSGSLPVPARGPKIGAKRGGDPTAALPTHD